MIDQLRGTPAYSQHTSRDLMAPRGMALQRGIPHQLVAAKQGTASGSGDTKAINIRSHTRGMGNPALKPILRHPVPGGVVKPRHVEPRKHVHFAERVCVRTITRVSELWRMAQADTQSVAGIASGGGVGNASHNVIPHHSVVGTISGHAREAGERLPMNSRASSGTGIISAGAAGAAGAPLLRHHLRGEPQPVAISQTTSCFSFLKGRGSAEKKSEYIAIRNAVLQVYGIKPSKWPRAFAPLSGVDTIKNVRGISEKKFDTLIRKLLDYAMQNRIKLPKNQDISIWKDSPTFVGAHGEPVRIRTDKEIKSKILIEKILPDLFNLSSCGGHGYYHSYSDEAILKVHSPDPEKKGSYKFANEHRPYFHQVKGKHTILQLATRGCTAAVTGMLILDKGGQVDMRTLRNTNLGNEESRRRHFTEAGFESVISKSTTLDELKRDIKKYGPAIINVDSGIGGHVVIVDAITDNAITVRDPAHGWMVDIKPEALNKTGTRCLHIGKRLATAEKK